jgi:hypothetical protein
VSRRALTSLPVPGIRLPIDYAGTLLLTAGLGVLLVAITRLGQGATLFSTSSLALMGAALLLLALFIWHEGRTAEPIMPLSLFRIPAVWMGCAILFICFFQVISLSVLIPFGMQTLDGISTDTAALNLISFSLAVPAGAFISGQIMMHSGRYKPLQIAGTGLLPLATLVLAYLGPHTDFAVGVALALAGVATGMSMPTSLVAVQNAAPHKNIGIATAMTALFRSMGGAIGVSILSSILFALLPHAGTAITSSLGMEHGLPGNAAHGSAFSGADPHAVSFAFRATLLASALISLIAHVLAWIIPENALRSGASSVAAKDAASTH